LQLTPLAASEIVAFLKPSLGSTVISLYHRGATEARTVRRQSSNHYAGRL